MSVLGYTSFGIPIFGTVPLFDGYPAVGLPLPLQKTPSRAANILMHGSGDATVQLDFREDDDPDTLDHYQFTFPMRAENETLFYRLKRLRARGVPFYLVTWDRETEIFTAGLSLNSWTLPRPTGVSVADHADFATYPAVALLDDVEQTVVDTGTPGAGEVKIVGRAVTTPTLDPGQILEIRYVVGYSVVVAEMPQTLAAVNDLSHQVVLIESREDAG